MKSIENIIKKLTIGILFIAVICLFFQNRTLIMKLKNAESNLNQEVESQLQSLLWVDTLQGRNFPIEYVFKADDLTQYEPIRKRYSIILLFFKNNCGECLETELELLNELYKTKTKESNYDILCIAISMNKFDILKFEKIKEIDIPIYFDKNDVILNWLNNKFVNLVLLIDENKKILRAHSPIVGNYKLIENNYFALKRFIN
jgi:hypothetical protein